MIIIHLIILHMINSHLIILYVNFNNSEENRDRMKYDQIDQGTGNILTN
jgi:hypothetical protein